MQTVEFFRDCFISEFFPDRIFLVFFRVAAGSDTKLIHQVDMTFLNKKFFVTLKVTLSLRSLNFFYRLRLNFKIFQKFNNKKCK